VKRLRLSGAALAVAALIAAMVASAAYGISTAVLGQLDYRSCIGDTGGDGCANVLALDDPVGIALADDESRVFVASRGSDAVSYFVRDRTTGTLEQLGQNRFACTSETGDGGACQDGHGLVGPTDVAMVGANAYVVTDGNDSIVTITKDSQNGKWQELDNSGSSRQFCLSAGAVSGCASGFRGLDDASSVITEGSSVYVGGPGSIGIFRRGEKGSLTQRSEEEGCVKTGGADGCASFPIPGTVENMAIPRGGKTLYAVDGDNLLVFSRNLATGALTGIQCLGPGGGCTPIHDVAGLSGVATDHTGNASSVYVTGADSHSIGVFARDKKTGLLTQLNVNGPSDGCVSEDGSGGACIAGSSLADLGNLVGLTVYKTNRFVYVAGGDGIANFSRDKKTRRLTQLADGTTSACITEGGTGGCAPGSGLGGLTDIFSTGGGKHVYVSGATFDSVATLHQGG
jgi:hypothetical protein